MSFIFGVTNYSQKTDFSEKIGIFEQENEKYKTEKACVNSLGESTFGCGLQRFSPSSLSECLPIKDESNGILFVADCVIDNKVDLKKELGLTEDVSDGRLLYESYLKWNDKFGEHVAGAFSFVAFHDKEKKTVLCSDHMNNRSLFYCVNEDGVVFSNSIASLARACKAGLSEKWATACLYTTTAGMSLYESYTPYKDILQVNPARIVTICGTHISEKKYWTTANIKFDSPEKTENEYRDLFVKTFKQCVHEIVNVNGNKGCTLSGGLDSTSVAALTAREIGEETLFSFTSVPEKDYDTKAPTAENDGHNVLDESQGVLKLCDMYKNISPEFVECHDKDAFTELPRLVPIIGYPIKSGQNLTWLDEIYARAEKKNIKLMLKGQYGNGTISYGNVLTSVYQDLARLKIGKAADTARRFCMRYHVPKKDFIKTFLGDVVTHTIVRKIDSDNILSDKELVKRFGIKRDTKKVLKDNSDSMIDTRKQRLKALHDAVDLNLLGMFDTIMGLNYGILIRDPAKDKRMVELCAKLPPSCLVAGGLERGQIRTFMEGYVPEGILKDIFRRGLQSADYYFRVRKNWDRRKSEIIDALETPNLTVYADKETVERLIELAKGTDVDKIDNEDIRRMNVLYSFSTFLRTCV